MKQKFYASTMIDEKPVLEQLDEFNKILDDLENIEIKLAEEDKALIQLSALPKSFENFNDTILFGRQESVNLEDVQIALKFKELQKVSDQNQTSIGEGLIVKNNLHKKKVNSKKSGNQGNKK